jgi:YgiT-type zinc finger domain-containing protein
MSDANNERDEQFSCPECRAGVMNLQHMTYYTWLSGELISVPDFPAWVCDVCGLREYDSRAIAWLNILLSPNTGRRRKPFQPLPLPQQPHPPLQP